MLNPGGRAPLPQSKIDELVRRYKAGEGGTSIARDLGTSKKTVYNYLVRLGVGLRPKSDRNGTTYTLPAGILAGVTSTGRPKGGTPGPKTFFREAAFAVLTDEVAYWLGFLTADGCVHSPKDRPTKRLFLRLSTKDRDHLERFKAFLGTTNAIVVKKHLDPAGVEQETCCLAVTSDPLCANLARWGILERKTGREVVHPELRDNRHFWRGCIDGDGCVYATPGTRVYLSGGRCVVEEWAAYVNRLTGWVMTINFQPGCFTGEVSGANARAVLRQMYDVDGPHLPRKKMKALANNKPEA